jgi:hypothetical protein
MAKQTELAYCKDRSAKVNLKQGFQHCVELHQCFSDEPCPLGGQFFPPPVAIKSEKNDPRLISRRNQD